MGEVNFFQDLGLQGMREHVHAEIEAMLNGKHRGHEASPHRFWRDMVDKLATLRECGAYDNAWWDDALVINHWGSVFLTLPEPWFGGKYTNHWPEGQTCVYLNTHVDETGLEVEEGYFLTKGMLV